MNPQHVGSAGVGSGPKELSKSYYCFGDSDVFTKMDYDDFGDKKDVNMRFINNPLDKRNRLTIKMNTGKKEEYMFITKKNSLDIEYLEVVIDGDEEIIDIYEENQLSDMHKKMYDEAVYHISVQNELV